VGVLHQDAGFFSIHARTEMVMDHFTLEEKKEVAVACDWNGWNISKDNKAIAICSPTNTIYINTSASSAARISNTCLTTSTASAAIYVIKTVFKRKN
jgi:hypothetical protein